MVHPLKGRHRDFYDSSNQNTGSDLSFKVGEHLKSLYLKALQAVANKTIWNKFFVFNALMGPFSALVRPFPKCEPVCVYVIRIIIDKTSAPPLPFPLIAPREHARIPQSDASGGHRGMLGALPQEGGANMIDPMLFGVRRQPIQLPRI